MVALGIDYGWTHPSAQAILEAGYRFVMRYLSHDPGKNLSPGELARLRGLGIDVGLVWETTAQRPLGGAPAGAADGARAKAMADLLGAPASTAIYAAYDWDVQPGQLPACREYQAAFEQAIRPHPGGVYGGYRVCASMCSPGRYLWQTAAWSDGKRALGLALYQRTTQVRVGQPGVLVDVNERLGDFGGWS